MEVRLKLTISVLSYDELGNKSLTYKDIFNGLSETYDRLISSVHNWQVIPNDDISITFTINKE